jgi:hypothetical protein
MLFLERDLWVSILTIGVLALSIPRRAAITLNYNIVAASNRPKRDAIFGDIATG